MTSACGLTATKGLHCTGNHVAISQLQTHSPVLCSVMLQPHSSNLTSDSAGGSVVGFAKRTDRQAGRGGRGSRSSLLPVFLLLLVWGGYYECHPSKKSSQWTSQKFPVDENSLQPFPSQQDQPGTPPTPPHSPGAQPRRDSSPASQHPALRSDAQLRGKCPLGSKF